MYKFFSALASNAFALGVQQVFIAWLAVGVFHLEASEVGWVQAAVLGPRLLVLLFAGTLVDFISPKRVYLAANAGLIATHLGAMAVLGQGAEDPTAGLPGFSFLLVYALALGCLSSFIQASKEKLLRHLESLPIASSISLMGMINQLAQGLGIFFVSFMDYFSLTWILATQALACTLALLSLASTSASTWLQHPQADKSSWLQAYGQLWQQPVLRQVYFIVGFNGLMHLGMFTVLLPLIARDEMGFSAFEYGMLQLVFMLGASAAHLWILKKKVQNPGQNLIFNILYGGFTAFAISKYPTVFGLYSLVFIWGCIAGASANVGRLIVQQYTQPNLVGRAMSMYQLALFGMAPVGALVAGHLIEGHSSWQTLHIIAYASGAVFFLFFFSRALWSVNAEPVNEKQAENTPQSKEE